MKMLSRNCPIALVVGAAGFLGSHLSEKLLDKKVQVVGVDNFSSGRQENLIEAGKDKNFYLLSQPAVQKLPVDLPRLDYAFFVISDDLPIHEYLVSLDNFLEECRKFKPKIVLVSSLDLYEVHSDSHKALREAERRLAQHAGENQTNARVVRLAALYGPRMHFLYRDPMSHLIKAAVKNELQKEVDALDFTTRSLYVEDAVDLLIKTVMHGATAQKIYDGSLLYPVKVAEVKQVLLDPLWHESRGFIPTELPPWSSPNLEKTMKELSWRPQVSLVEGLKETLRFFKENPAFIEKEPEETAVPKEEEPRVEEKAVGEEPKKKVPRSFSFAIGKRVKTYFLVGAGLALIAYALVFPAISLGVLAFNFNSYLKQSGEDLSLGNISAASLEAGLAKRGVENLQQTLKSVAFISRTGVGASQFETVSQSVQIGSDVVEAIEHGALAVSAVSQALKTVSGEQEINGTAYFVQANEDLETADRLLGLALAQLSDPDYQNSLPVFLREKIVSWQKQVTAYKQTADYSQAITYLSSHLIPSSGKREYLVVLQDNSTIRPGGGAAITFGQLSFSDGKLTGIKTGSVAALDKGQKETVAPPEDLAKDLNQTAWLMRDGSFEADGPSNGKTAQWFYNHYTGANIDGVFLMDLTAAGRLLQVLGPISLDNGQTVNSQNLTETIEASADSGTTGAAILKELLGRLFFLSKQNWLDLTNTIGSSFDEKHLLVYLADPNDLSYTVSKNWAGLMPRQTKEGAGERNEFLSLSETNLGTFGSNQNIKRSLALEDSIKQSGEVSHKLTVSYTSGSDKPYKSRLKVYLAGGSKVEKVSWGGEEITSSVKSFSDFGWAGYSMLLTLNPTESKSLILQYSDGGLFNFKDNKLIYRTDLVKQPGTENDGLEYRISYPIEFKAISDQTAQNPLVITTNFSRDRNFEIILQKP